MRNLEVVYYYFVHDIFYVNNLNSQIWENPPYGINAQFTQCAFLVSPDFVISMSKNPSSNSYRHLRRLVVSYKGEIAFISIYLLCTAAVYGARC